MALPTSMSTSMLQTRYGARFVAYPSSPEFGLEWQFSTAAAAPTSKWVSLRLPPSPGNQVTQTWELPYSTKLVYARARHWRLGYADGPFTPTTSAPVQPLADLMPFPAGTGASDHLNPQASVLPISTGSASGILAFNTGGTSTISGHMPFGWNLGADITLYRPDGTTLTIKQTTSTDRPTAVTGSVAGGALGARTFQVVVAYVKDTMIYYRSANVPQAVAANNLLTVTAPTAVAGYDGWCVGLTTGTNGNQVLQGILNGGTTGLIAFGTNYTEPVGGATNSFASATPINLAQQVGYILATELTASTTYWWYCGFDPMVGANANLRFAPLTSGGSAITTQSPQHAAAVNGDRFYGLSFSGVSQATPAAGNTLSGNLFTPKYQ